MAVRDGSFSFSFSRHNSDVRELLEKKVEESQKTNKKFVRTDYMCEAVRFYEQYKDVIANGGVSPILIQSKPAEIEEQEDKKTPIKTKFNMDSIKTSDLEED